MAYLVVRCDALRGSSHDEAVQLFASQSLFFPARLSTWAHDSSKACVERSSTKLNKPLKWHVSCQEEEQLRHLSEVSSAEFYCPVCRNDLQIILLCRVMWGNKDQQECLLQKQRGSSWNKEANAPSMRTSSQYIRETDAAFDDLMQVPFQQLRPEFRRSFQASLSMWIWLKCSCWAENVFWKIQCPFVLSEWGPADTTPSSRAQFTLHLLGFHWLTLRRSETFRSCSAAEDHPRQTTDFENHSGRWFVAVIEM